MEVVLQADKYALPAMYMSHRRGAPKRYLFRYGTPTLATRHVQSLSPPSCPINTTGMYRSHCDDAGDDEVCDDHSGGCRRGYLYGGVASMVDDVMSFRASLCDDEVTDGEGWTGGTGDESLGGGFDLPFLLPLSGDGGVRPRG